MAIRLGIMGFGRVGKNIFRQACQCDDIEVVAISDRGSCESMAYLLEYDTIYGNFPGEVELKGKYLEAGGQRARLLRGTVPEDMPWEAYGADIIVDSTGAFRLRQELEGHLHAGAQRVILTRPALDDIDRTIIHGLNDDTLTAQDRLVSCGSSTTHVLGLLIKVLDEAVGVEQAIMTTVHAYSSDQRLSDSVTPNLRQSRSAAENLIPNWTWSPGMIESIMPHLKGKISGMAINVPVPNGSNVDLNTQLKREVSREEVNEFVRVAAEGVLKPYLEYVSDPIVSSDIVGNVHSAIFDSMATIALPGGLVKTVSWYDNGWGYAGRILETARVLGGFVAAEEQS